LRIYFHIDASKIEILPEGDFDIYYPLICHKIQLLRLGSERVDYEAPRLFSDINFSVSDHSKKSKFTGNRVVIEVEVHNQNESQTVNHKQNFNSSHEKAYKKFEEIELLHYTKKPNQDDQVMVINESKVCACCIVFIHIIPVIVNYSITQIEVVLSYYIINIPCVLKVYVYIIYFVYSVCFLGIYST